MFDNREVVRRSVAVSPDVVSGLVPLPTPDSGKRIMQTGERTFAEAGAFKDRWIDFSDGENSDDLEWGETDFGKDSYIVSEVLPPPPSEDLDIDRLPPIEGSLERINASIDRLEGRAPRKRPNGGRHRQTDDDDEHHLKYHHRGENDDLPGGFEIPPSRETLASQQSISTTTAGSQIEQEIIEAKPKSRRGSENSLVLKETPSMIIERINNSAHWCECKDVDPSTIKCPECLVLGGHEKWCIYARSTSNEGFPCPQCGKPIKRNTIRGPANYKASRASRHSYSTRSSDSAKPEEEVRRVRFEEDLDQTERLQHVQELEKLRAKSETETDEDYLNVEEIISDKERYGKLWTSPTSDRDSDGEESSRPNHWPGVDPAIHRKAYLKALLNININRIKKLEEIDEHYYANRLRRPHVFSYFKLRPHQEKANEAAGGPLQIGITPPNGPAPVSRRAMKHIFGKVKVDDFYPGGKHNPRLTMSLQEEAKKQTMPVHSIRYAKTPRT